MSNLEITRPNDKKTVKKGRRAARFVGGREDFGDGTLGRAVESRGRGCGARGWEWQGVKIRALRERLIKGCKLTSANDAAA